MRTIYIGDIHGEIEKLNSIIEKLPLNAKWVFLGDYCNYGDHTKEVIDKLIKIRKMKPNTVFLKGNHEYHLINYINDAITYYDVVKMSGLKTLRSYVKNDVIGSVREELIKKMPIEHIDFFNTLQVYYEDEFVFASHSGINLNDVNSREEKDLLFNTNLSGMNGAIDKVIICGHYRLECNSPFIEDQLICIDTGCGINDGPLSAYDFFDKSVISSS